MKRTILKIMTMLFAMLLLATSLPIASLADGIKQVSEEVKALSKADDNTSDTVSSPEFLELSDGYINVKVSTSNGGFYVGTEEGDVITKKDNNSDLTYNDKEFDTSFTSFRVTRGDEVQDFIFGRDYSYLGIETSNVTVYKSADNAIVAEWQADGIIFRQTIALMGTDTYQHGMAYISYSATNTTEENIDNIEARVMMDTALGLSDYGYYMLGQNDGSYVAVQTEKTVSGSDYSNYFFAYDSKTSPNATSYTLNASVAGEMIVPKKVTFAHWFNLASTVFDYTPSKDTPIDFTDVYGSVDHLSADSAVALYYDMSSAASLSDSKQISLYYGVYSNYNAGDADVALNFTSSGTMLFTKEETGYKDINGILPGNFSTTIKVQNITESTIDKLAVAIYPEEAIIPHNGKNFVEDFSIENPFYKEITELKAGEVRDVRFDFQLDPTMATSYRKIKIVVYNTTAQASFSDDNQIIEENIYVLCPGAQSAEVGFTGMTPDTVFIKGKRFAYITGTNFGLIRDKTQYRLILRPQDGGEDIVLDMDKVVINTELNTATLVLDMELRATTYDIIIDWNDNTVEDIKNDALQLVVTDIAQPGDPGYVSSGVYGIVTIERNGTSYEIINYPTEDAYKSTSTPNEDIMLVLRGDFNVLSSEEKGRYSAEAITLMDGEVININDCLDVKNGRVTVTKNFDENGKQTSIDVDIDGKVYTTKANTKVWDGVLAISSFEEGKLYELPVYSEQGENKGVSEGAELVRLIWPGAASITQSLAGLLLNFRYGEFALMEQGNSKERVIAFGASLDPSILVPPGFVGTQKHYSNLEKKQLEMGVSAYTAAQLRKTDTMYAKDQAKWRNEQIGTLNFYMDDILFGAGGFIGFNTSVEVGIPSYAEPLPYIQGTLELKIINDYWEFGVSGTADMMVFEMEATLKLKSYNGIPVPDEFYFFIGGVKPGLPIDPFGVFWVRGAGAGVSEIYETFFGGQTVPPLTLLISGEFALFNVLAARADLSLSAQGFSGYLNDVNVAGVTIIDSVGGSVYWYPSLNISFAVRINILDCIIGEGGIVLKETEDGMYFCGYARARVKIPDSIWFIGGTEIGSASIGISTEKVWGSVKVIGIGVGIKYYWGGDVDIDVGETYDVPSPFSARTLSLPVYTDTATGKTLYMSLTNDVALLSDEEAGIDKTEIKSSEDKLTHSFTLDPNANEDTLIALSFTADNELMAQDYKNRIKVNIADANYKLEWFDSAYAADHIANSGTNAIFRYDEESKTATVTISVTNMTNYGKEIVVTSSTSTDIELYGIARLADFDTIEMNEEKTEVTVTGEGLNKLSKLGIYAEDKNGALYLLAEQSEVEFAEDKVTSQITIPQNLPSGSYKLKAIGTMTDENGAETASPMIEMSFDYVNANQPKAPTSAQIGLSGNYTLTLDTTIENAVDGYVTTVYEITENGYEATVFADTITELTDDETGSLSKSIALGGRYTTTDENGVTTVLGLEAGKKYAVSVQGYKLMDDGSRLLSEPTLSNEVMMVMPVIIAPELSIDGAGKVELGDTGIEIDTINKNTFTIKITGTEALSTGYYTINDGEKTVWDGKDIFFEGIEDGMYTITLEGKSTTNDAFSTKYQFSVDTTAPSLLLSSPQGGGFFSGNSTTVTGITEAYSTVKIYVEGSLTTTLKADKDGSFTGVASLDESLAYQDIKIYATDSAGNVSMPFGCTLTNDALGAADLTPVILYNGKEISAIVTGTEAKQLTMAFKTENRYITMNEGSSAYSRIEWTSEIISKSAQVSKNGALTGDNGAQGIVMATLDNRTAVIELVSINLTATSISVDAPNNSVVYNAQPQEPSVIIDSYEELKEDVDYTVTYVNNTNVGTASAIITATKGGKCVGQEIVDFTIEACPINNTEISVSDDGSENPSVTIKLGSYELVRDKDYTLTYQVSEDEDEVIVTIVGKGNFTGVFSQSYEIKSFDHGIWIIPTVTIALLGVAYLVLFLIKKKRASKKTTVSVASAPNEKKAIGSDSEATDEKSEEPKNEKTEKSEDVSISEKDNSN